MCDDYDFAPEILTLRLECDCDRGWIECAPHSYDPRNGEPICEAYRCEACNGTGYVDVDFVPRTEADLIDEDAEMFEGT
jgi:hypothetical protein